MPTSPLPRRSSNKAAALIIVLAFVVILTGVALAYFTRTTSDRQLAQSSFNDTSADLLARSALDVVVGDFKQEIVNGSTIATPSPGTTIYVPTSAANVIPVYNPTPSPSPALAILNLIRRSVRSDAIPFPAVASRASSVNSTVDPSANGRFVSLARWNSHYLVPKPSPSTDTGSDPITNGFSGPNYWAPDWVIVTRAGPTPFASWDATLADARSTNNNYAIGRYAYAVYDEGGLLNMNIAGYPAAASPMPSLPPEIARKGVPATADLTGPELFPAGATLNLANQIVGFRNYASAQQGTPVPGTNITGAFGSFVFSKPAVSNFIDYAIGSPLGQPKVGFGPSGRDFIAVNPVSTPVGLSFRTDQAFMTRTELINFFKNVSSAAQTIRNLDKLQYMGTFSLERNKPTLPLTPAWPSTWPRVVLPQRFYLGNLNLAVYPSPTPTPTVTPTPTATPSLTPTVLTSLGLQFVSAASPTPTPAPPTPTATPSPSPCIGQVRWEYVGNQNVSGTPTPLPFIPALPSDLTKLDLFQYINYALFGVNTADSDPNHFPFTLGIGAALIDMYDANALATGIYYGSSAATCDLSPPINACLVYGAEQNGSSVWYQPPTCITPAPSTPQPLVTPTPPINSPVRSVGELGWAYSILNAANNRNISTSSAPSFLIDFKDPYDPNTNPDPALLDFFTYNSAPLRAGIVSLNTRQPAVLAALLRTAFYQEPPTLFLLQLTQPINAANAIVTATTAQPAMSRADIARLAGAPTLDPFNLPTSDWRYQDRKDTFARVLSEITQTRTWGLLIDVVAQTGHYKPNATGLAEFIVEGEKRYWLHVAIDRFDGTIVGQQLEEVTE
jgi:hypothetical protein